MRIVRVRKHYTNAPRNISLARPFAHARSARRDNYASVDALRFSSKRERIRLEAAFPGKCNDTSEHANLMRAYLLLECYSYTGIAVLGKCFVD